MEVERPKKGQTWKVVGVGSVKILKVGKASHSTIINGDKIHIWCATYQVIGTTRTGKFTEVDVKEFNGAYRLHLRRKRKADAE